ncbi:MAG: sulfatase-like hydrolase/transferase [Acidobacteriia bacterium]|nr:sulfatase-like hydrolase/transferase [Terriglobia bacterium]
MNRRDFLKTTAAAPAAFAKAQTGRRPNFLFIFCDDMGWGDLPSYGHTNTVAHGGWTVRGELNMPHTDRLAREGTRFTQFYVAAPVCSPSRAGIMTGQFPSRLGIHDYLATPEQNRRHGVVDYLDPKTPTVTRLLQQSGYATGHFGKWHLGSGNSAPDPETYGINRYDPCMKGPGARVRSSETIAGEAISFIEQHRDKPFFINAWMYDPHSPLQPTDEMMEPYKSLGTGWAGHRGSMEIYYGVLTNLDRQIGRMLDKLDQLGLAENTVVMLSSDNGPESGLIPFVSHYGVAASAGPFRGIKRSLYEGGIRTPFTLRWPGHTPAGNVDGASVIAGVDFLPTVCNLAGVNHPAVDGENCSDAFRGKPRTRRKPLFWENRFPVYGHVLDQSPMLAARDSNWKLLMNPDKSRLELYDIPRDPTEMNNLAAAHLSQVVKLLSARLLAWQKELPKGYIHPDAGRGGYPWPKAMKSQ